MAVRLGFPTNPTIGQGYSIGGKTWKWNGYGWALEASGVGFTGSQGIASYVGSQGIQGIQGPPDGYTGSRGYTGSVGYVGSAGYLGSFGYTGSRGFTGSVGYDGSRGDKGFPGDVTTGKAIAMAIVFGG